MRWKGLVLLLLLGGACLMAMGCTHTIAYGRYVPNSQFAYPNSTVKSLGPTQGSVVKVIKEDDPGITIEDMKNAYNEALGKVQGANILINYKEDTKLTLRMFDKSMIEYRIEGEAARMDIGAHIKRGGGGQ